MTANDGESRPAQARNDGADGNDGDLRTHSNAEIDRDADPDLAAQADAIQERFQWGDAR